MRIVQYFIYDKKTLKRVKTIGCNKADAIKELNKLNNSDYEIGVKWSNL